MIAVVGLTIGLVLVPAVGGSFRALADVRMRHVSTLLALFVAQAVVRGHLPFRTETLLAVPAWSAITLALLVVLARQPEPARVLILCLGLSVNLLVTLLNAGMPVLGGSGALPATPGGGTFYHAASAADIAVVLADVLPAPGAWLLSLGDLLLIVGVATFVIGASCSRAEKMEELASNCGSN